MDYNKVRDSFMKPTSVQIPITFDVPKVESENKRQAVIISAIIALVSLVIIGLTWKGQGFILSKILITFSIGFFVVLLVRFFLLKEGRISDATERIIAQDYKLEDKKFWGIFDIEKVKPYVCHYVSGQKGVFVRFNKDVLIGENATQESHYTGLSEMYSTADSLGLKLIHVDYMDSVGKDPRIQGFYESIADCENPVLKNMLLSIYGDLELNLQEEYSSFDVYCIYTNSNSFDFKYNVGVTISAGLNANYKSFSYLDSDNIKELTMSLFNLEEFGIVKASKSLMQDDALSIVKPLSVVDMATGNETIINKSSVEIKEDAIKKEQLGNKKGDVVNKDKDVVSFKDKSSILDIFSTDNALATDILVKNDTDVASKPVSSEVKHKVEPLPVNNAVKPQVVQQRDTSKVKTDLGLDKAVIGSTSIQREEALRKQRNVKPSNKDNEKLDIF